MKLCECGCGKEVTKEGNRFIQYHNRRGKTKENDEGRRKQAEKSSKKMKGRTKENNKGKRIQAEKMTGRTRENHEGVKKQAEYMENGGAVYANSFPKHGYKNHTEWMESSGAVYMNSFIQNPSKLQVDTWKIVCKISPYVYLNYPVTHLENTYSIDIAIPKLEIAIEYDGSYWHQDKENDLKRQKELEEDGWKFIRYVDKVPTKEQVLEDLFHFISSHKKHHHSHEKHG